MERTKLILFAPFRTGRTWKLAATAYLCRIGTMFFPFPLIYLGFLPAIRSKGALAMIGLCAGILIGTAVWAWLFHLCSRLQFAYFDIMVNRGEFVAPAWRKYGPQSRRWTGIKLLIGTGVALACAVPLAAYIRNLIPLFRSVQTLAPGESPPPQFVGAIFVTYGVLALLFGSFFLISSLMADFTVPSLALENASLGEAFRRMLALIRQEPGEFALYTVLKIGLAMAMYMGAMIAAELAIILVTLIVFLIAGLIGFVLHLIGIPSAVLTALAILLGIAWYVFAIGYGLLLAIGPVFTFLDAYALYFLGGRYPLLGDLLDRSTPPPPAPYFIPAPGNPVAPV